MSQDLNIALNRIDESIVALLRERERVAAAISGDRNATIAASPFRQPFAVDVQRQVKAFEHFVPGMWFGFPQEASPTIMTTQTADADDLLSPPDHHFVFSFSLEGASKSPWITLEKELVSLPSDKAGRVVVALKAWASVPAALQFQLSIPRLDEPDARADVGRIALTRRFVTENLSHDIDPALLANVDPSRCMRLLAFLPREDVRISMAYYTTLLSARE